MVNDIETIESIEESILIVLQKTDEFIDNKYQLGIISDEKYLGYLICLREFSAESRYIINQLHQDFWLNGS